MQLLCYGDELHARFVTWVFWFVTVTKTLSTHYRWPSRENVYGFDGCYKKIKSPIYFILFSTWCLLEWAETVARHWAIGKHPITAPKQAGQLAIYSWDMVTRSVTATSLGAFCQTNSSSFLGGICLFFGGQAGSRTHPIGSKRTTLKKRCQFIGMCADNVRLLDSSVIVWASATPPPHGADKVMWPTLTPTPTRSWQSAIGEAIVLAIQISQAERARKCMPNVALIFMPEPIADWRYTEGNDTVFLGCINTYIYRSYTFK